MELLRRSGATVDTPRSNGEALDLLRANRYDVAVSDVRRDNEGPGSELKGVELAEKVYSGWRMQTILFTANFDPSSFPNYTIADQLTLVRRVRSSVFAITNRTDETLHYIMDMLERLSQPVGVINCPCSSLLHSHSQH